MIRVQDQAFDTAAELAKLKQGRTDIGGSVVFVGTMRDLSDGVAVSAMTLEHYPGMTEKALSEIDAEAHRRWLRAIRWMRVRHRAWPDRVPWRACPD